jgi:hypothetical protein
MKIRPMTWILLSILALAFAVWRAELASVPETPLQTLEERQNETHTLIPGTPEYADYLNRINKTNSEMGHPTHFGAVDRDAHYQGNT